MVVNLGVWIKLLSQTYIVYCRVLFQQNKDALGDDGVFYLFASVCAVGVVFVALCVPETKGLALEEIEAKFDGRSFEHPDVWY